MERAIFSVDGGILQFVAIGRQDSLEWMADNHPLFGLFHELQIVK
jgi:hypothetical protein